MDLYGIICELNRKGRGNTTALNYKKPAFWIIIVVLIASVAVAVCFTTKPKDKVATDTGQILELYDAFLKQGTKDNNYGEPIWFCYNDIEKRYYSFFDIDGNGIEELILGEDMGKGRRRGTVFMYIFTIKDGAVKGQNVHTFNVEWQPNKPRMYKDGTIRVGGSDPEWVGDHYTYYRFVNGELKPYILLGYRVGINAINHKTPDTWQYIDYTSENHEEKEIAKKKFDRIKKKIEGDGQTVILDWKPMTDFVNP